MKSSGRIGLLILALPIAYLTMCSTYYAAEPIRATVIDAETGQPIEGVVVVAHWELEGGLEGGSNMGQVKVLESITDENGILNFPAWGPKRVSSGILSNTRLKDKDPGLLFFKSSYKYLSIQNNKGLEKTASKGPIVRTSIWNGKKIKLKKFRGTISEYADEIDHFTSDLYVLVSQGSECEWRSIPLTIAALGRLEIIYKSANLDRGTFYNYLIWNDEGYIKKGCGSTKKFIMEHEQ